MIKFNFLQTIHDVVCDVKPIILPAPQQPPSEALNALRAHKSYVAFPNNVEDQFGEQEIFNYRKRANTFVDVRPKPVAKPPKRRQTMQTVERVLCEACGESYSENYIKIHRGTKKHQKNSRKMKAANRL